MILKTFTKKMDNNTKNIKLTWNVDLNQTIFLDLEIFKKNGLFQTRNHFKPTDRNAYIPLNSCHHKMWLCNFPRRQFIRLRNCSSEEEFLLQSQVLANRVIQKGHTSTHIKTDDDG